MKWDEFRALEAFAILYDIQVDEENRQPALCGLGVKAKATDTAGGLFVALPQSRKGREEAWPWEENPLRLSLEETWRQLGLRVAVDTSAAPAWIPKTTLRRLIHLPELLPPPGHSLPPADSAALPLHEYWRLLLLVKLSRATLMAKPDSASDPALDDLARRLVVHLPPDPRILLQLGGSMTDEIMRLFLLRVMYLCEASACSLDHQSINFADECLGLINSFLGQLADITGQESLGQKGVCVYELVARYNKAQGMLHSRQHERALSEFAEVFRYLADASRGDDETMYFSPPKSGWVRHLAWSARDRSLFDAYVGIPALLQSADVLTNLQRSGDVENLLLHSRAMRPGARWTQYQKNRRRVLLARASLDKGGALPRSFPREPSREYRLALQELAVLTQSTRDPAVRLRYLRQRVSLAARDRTEFDQALYDWIEGLQYCDNSSRDWIDYLSASLPELEGGRWPSDHATFQKAVLDFVADPGWRDHKLEARKALVEHLWDIIEQLSLPVVSGFKGGSDERR